MARKKKTTPQDITAQQFREDYAGDIQDVPISEFIYNDNVQYMVYTIENRAIPSVIDGMKPGQRRLLYSMYHDGVVASGKTMKSSRLASNAVGRYHPHGDAAMYETLVGLAAPYHRAPLIKGDGAFGMSPGDKPASPRYTEAKLSDLGMSVVEELKDKAVPFVPTYDEESEEPLYLTPQFPVLLINGVQGIAEAYSTLIPPHNPHEIIAACLAVIDNPGITDDELADIITGPDWATGGMVIGSRDEIRKYIATGRGKITVRCSYDIAKSAREIIVNELPPGVSADSLIEEVRDKVRSGAIDGVSDVLAVADRTHPFRMVIRGKRGTNMEALANELLSKTSLETTFAVSMVALGEDRVPAWWSVKEQLQEFIKLRNSIIVERSTSRLGTTRKKHTQATALATVLLDKERAVDIVMRADTDKDAVIGLRDAFDLTDEQAEYIADTPIKRLSKGNVLDVTKRVEALAKEIASLERLLGSKKRRMTAIAKELREVEKKFAEPRFDRKTVINHDEKPARRTATRADMSKRLSSWKLDVDNGILSDTGDDIPEGHHVWSVFSNGRIKLFAGGGLPQRMTPKTVAPDMTGLVSCGTVPPGEKDILVASSEGKIIRISASEKSIKPQGIAGSGIQGMKLGKDAVVVGAVVANDEDVVLTRSVDGWKITRVDDIPVKGKGTQGVMVHKLRSGDSGVYDIMVAPKEAGFMIDGKKGVVSARATATHRGRADNVSVGEN